VEHCHVYNKKHLNLSSFKIRYPSNDWLRRPCTNTINSIILLQNLSVHTQPLWRTIYIHLYTMQIYYVYSSICNANILMHTTQDPISSFIVSHLWYVICPTYWNNISNPSWTNKIILKNTHLMWKKKWTYIFWQVILIIIKMRFVLKIKYI